MISGRAGLFLNGRKPAKNRLLGGKPITTAT